MKYYSAKTVTKILGVTAQTLRNWDKENKLKLTYVKTLTIILNSIMSSFTFIFNYRSFTILSI